MRVFIFRLQVGIRPMAEFIKLISVLFLLFRISLYRAAFFVFLLVSAKHSFASVCKLRPMVQL